MEILAEEGGGSPAGKRYLASFRIMSKVNEKINEGIRVSELDAIKRKTKVGDKIKIRTWKANDDDGSKSYLGVVKVATVIAKFPRLVLLELPGGTKETVTWLELLLERKIPREVLKREFTCREGGYRFYSDGSGFHW